jgi:hypothetical protein
MPVIHAIRKWLREGVPVHAEGAQRQQVVRAKQGNHVEEGDKRYG